MVAKNLGGQNIDLGRLVDRFDRILAEQLVSPRDQVINVLHDDRFLVGRDAVAGNQVRVEWILLPLHYLVLEFLPFLQLIRVSACVIEEF